MKRVGLIGCGAIGSELAAAVDARRVDAKLVAVFDVYTDVANKLAAKLRHRPIVARNLKEFVATKMDVVVEAASQEAVRRYAAKVLERHDVMIMSVGALLGGKLYNRLRRIAEKNGRRIYLPSGAIAGIDAIRSSRHLLKDVTLTTTKNPKGLRGAPFLKSRRIDLAKIRKAKIIYEGRAEEAVKLFPANINVAAALSLAGIGGRKTRVRIIADPRARHNIHEITARGSFGEMRFTMKNIPSPRNPKTSYLAVLSAIECLRSICDDRIRIGT